MTFAAEQTDLIEDPEESQFRALESKAVRGTYLVTIAYGLTQILRFTSTAVLSRMFAPDLFGIMALVTTVMVGLYLFSHIGVQDSIIQHPRGDERVFLNTAWTLQVIRGFALFAITFPLAWPVARFYHEPSMAWILPVLGFGCAIAGLSSSSLLTLARHLGVGKLSALELMQQAIQFAVTWAWAHFQPTLIALVAGRLISEIVRTVVSYGMMPEVRPRLEWDRDSLHELVKFGRWILVGTALTFLALQSDRLILAKLISFRMLGIYGIAFALSDVPRQIILQFCSRVGYPFIAKFSSRPRSEYQAIVLKYRSPVLILGGILLVLTICTGDFCVRLIFDRRYYDAAWMIGILTLGLWHTLLYSTTSQAILSLQKAHYNALGYLVYCITLYAGLPIGFHYLGMTGAVLAVALSDLPVYFVNVISAKREGMKLYWQDAKLTAGFVVCLLAALYLRKLLGLGSPFDHVRW